MGYWIDYRTSFGWLSCSGTFYICISPVIFSFFMVDSPREESNLSILGSKDILELWNMWSVRERRSQIMFLIVAPPLFFIPYGKLIIFKKYQFVIYHKGKRFLWYVHMHVLFWELDKPHCNVFYCGAWFKLMFSLLCLSIKTCPVTWMKFYPWSFGTPGCFMLLSCVCIRGVSRTT